MIVEYNEWHTYGGIISSKDFIECLDINKFAEHFRLYPKEINIINIIDVLNLENYFIDDDYYMEHLEDCDLYYGVLLWGKCDLSNLNEDIQDFESKMVMLGNIYNFFNYNKFIEKTKKQKYKMHKVPIH